MIQQVTRYGRKVRSPVNEYTDRVYLPGSGFIGADHYDQSFIGGNETSFGVALEMAVENMLYDDNSNEMKDFIVNDGEEEEEESDVDEESEEEYEDESEEDEEEEYEESDEEDE